MDFLRRAAFAFLSLIALSGCRQNHAARELLERELRLQEDRIYQLEAQLEDTRRELDHASGKPFSRSPLGTDCPMPGMTILESPPAVVVPAPVIRSTPTPPPSSKPTVVPPPSSGTFAPPTIELPPQTPPEKTQAAPYSGPPTISPPSPDVPEGLPSRRGTTGSPTTTPTVPKEPLPSTPPNIPPPFKNMSSPKFLPPGSKPQRLDPSAATELTPTDAVAPALEDDRRVKSITLSRATRGINLDGKAGDDGVLVVVEARNAKGEVIPTTGEASIVLIDPAAPGDAARYARWDFGRDDAAPLYRAATAGGGAGFYFELPWPDAPPTHSRLKLFVRFMAGEQQLQIDRDLNVHLGDGAARVWQNPHSAPAGDIVRTAAVPKTSDVKPAASTELNWGVPRKSPAVLPAFTADGALPVATPPSPSDMPAGPALIPAAP